MDGTATAADNLALLAVAPLLLLLVAIPPLHGASHARDAAREAGHRRVVRHRVLPTAARGGEGGRTSDDAAAAAAFVVVVVAAAAAAAAAVAAESARRGGDGGRRQRRTLRLIN